ncbi:hypothetical protein IAU60_003865 [Kwoniella sp. DSM 27419]
MSPWERAKLAASDLTSSQTSPEDRGIVLSLTIDRHGNSRSSSPSDRPPQQRIVSGSLKDRIAKFNSNASAPPPVPKQHYGGTGLGVPSRGGLVGNRIPSLDPKTAGMVSSAQPGSRRISENRGLIGNRIPSVSGGGSINPVTGQLTGSSAGKGSSGDAGAGTPTPPPAKKSATTSAAARSASPAGSVDSSVASAPVTVESSTSPITSRSSSPPTSPGTGVPSNLLTASLPQSDGETAQGLATPSSTRAEAGDTVSEMSLSAPSTPIASDTPPLPAPEYDLVAPNLKLATANAAANAGVPHHPMARGMSAQSGGSHTFAPSVSSSLAAQSRGSEEDTRMMQDVSGVSTPMGTPRAAHRELGEGSVAGEGSVMGENDVDELGDKLKGLEVEEDKEGTPEPPKEDPKEAGAGSPEVAAREQKNEDQAPAGPDNMKRDGEAFQQPQISSGDPNQAPDLDDLKAGKLSPSPASQTKPEEPSQPASASTDNTSEDPNQASDLADLKAGKLAHSADHDKNPSEITGGQVPANAMAGDAMAQNLAEEEIAPEDVKEQGGEAGKTIEEVNTADQILPPPGEAELFDAGLGQVDDRPVLVKPGELEIKEGGGQGLPGSTSWFEDTFKKDDKNKGQDDQGQLEDVTAEEIQSDAPEQDDQSVMDQPEIESPSPAPQSGESAPAASSLAGDDHDNKEMPHQNHLSNFPDTPQVTEDPKQDSESPNQAETPKAGPIDMPDPADLDTQTDQPAVTAIGTEVHKEEVTPSRAPVQLHLEPAPIAQPAEGAQGLDTSALDFDDDKTPAAEIDPPSFPEPPTADPDVEDPLPSTPAEPATALPSQQANDSAASTPIDGSFLKSFPDVPDEEKPRVEVHVSSPATTPQKAKRSSISQSPERAHQVAEPSTPVANLPGHSKSLSRSHLAKEAEQGGRQDLDVNDPDATPQASKGLNKRLSTRKSPKSPLLDDEDPGDFEPGEEGWAVVTK